MLWCEFPCAKHDPPAIERVQIPCENLCSFLEHWCFGSLCLTARAFLHLPIVHAVMSIILHHIHYACHWESYEIFQVFVHISYTLVIYYAMLSRESSNMFPRYGCSCVTYHSQVLMYLPLRESRKLANFCASISDTGSTKRYACHWDTMDTIQSLKN